MDGRRMTRVAAIGSLVLSSCLGGSLDARGADEQSGEILTPAPADQPRINPATVFGVRPGHPVLYIVAAKTKECKPC